MAKSVADTYRSFLGLPTQDDKKKTENTSKNSSASATATQTKSAEDTYRSFLGLPAKSEQTTPVPILGQADKKYMPRASDAVKKYNEIKKSTAPTAAEMIPVQMRATARKAENAPMVSDTLPAQFEYGGGAKIVRDTLDKQIAQARADIAASDTTAKPWYERAFAPESERSAAYVAQTEKSAAEERLKDASTQKYTFNANYNSQLGIEAAYRGETLTPSQYRNSIGAEGSEQGYKVYLSSLPTEKVQQIYDAAIKDKNSTEDDLSVISGIITEKKDKDVYDKIDKNGDRKKFDRLMNLKAAIDEYNNKPGVSGITGADNEYNLTLYNDLAKELGEKYGDINAAMGSYGKVSAEEFKQTLLGGTLDFIERHPVIGGITMSAASVLSSPARGIIALQGYLDDGKGVNTYGLGNIFNEFSQTATAAVGDKIKTELAGRYGSGWGTFGKWLYSAGVSSAESLLTMAAGEGVGEAIFFVNAATETYRSALDRGLDIPHALATAAAAGTAEVLFEHLSLDRLRDVIASGGRISQSTLIDWLVSAGIEGSEELFTDAANNISDMLINGGANEFARTIQTYMSQGMTEEEARIAAAKDIAAQMGESFIVGAMSGGIMTAGIETAYNVTNRVSGVVNGISAVNGIIRAIGDIKKQNNAYIRDEKINHDRAGSKNNTVEVDAANQNVDNIDENGNIVNFAETDNTNAATDTASSTLLLEAAREAAQREAQENGAEKTFEYIPETPVKSGNSTETIQSEEAEEKPVYEAKTEEKNTSDEPSARKIASVNRIKGEAVITVELSDGRKVNSDKANYADDEQKTLFEGLAKNKDYSVTDINTLIKIKDTVPEMDADTFVSAANEGYGYGAGGLKREYIRADAAFNELPDSTQKLIYDLGANARTSRDTARADSIRKSAKGTTDSWRGGTVKSRDKSVTIDSLKKTFNDAQNIAFKVLTFYADATGIDIDLYASEPNEAGEYTASQGEYNRSTRRIAIDINAGLRYGKDVNSLGKYTALRTFGHEIVHFSKDFAPEEISELESAVFDYLESKGISTADLIDDLMMKDNRLSYTDASQEVVAEGLTDALGESDFVENLCKEHRSLAQKIADKLKEFIAMLKNAWAKLNKSSYAATNGLKEEVNGEIQYAENILKKYDAALKTAVENYQRTFMDETVTEKTADEVINTTEESTVKGAEEKSASVQTSTNNKQSESKKEIVSKNKVGDYIRVIDGTIGKVRSVYDGGDGSVWYSAETENGDRFSVPERNAINFNAQAADINGFLDTIGNKAQKTRAKNKLTLPEYNFIKGLADNADTYAKDISNVKRFGNQEKTVHEYRVYGVEKDAPTAFKELDKIEYDFYNYLKGNEGENDAEIRESGGREQEDRSDNGGAVLQPAHNRAGASRLLDEQQAADVQRAGTERNAVEPVEAGERQTGRSDNGADAADRTGGSNGNSEERDLRRDAELNEEAAELPEVVEEEIAQKSTEEPKGSNFVIGDSLDLPSGEKARFRTNVDAIRLIAKLEAENRFATAEEQTALSKYVGWGGLSNAFGEMVFNRESRKNEMRAKSGWENEFNELRSLVDEGIITEDEYKAMSASTVNAHYTSIDVIKGMYTGLKMLGYAGGRMLEPSSGVGNFVGAMPAEMTAGVKSWTMVELDRVTGLIAKYLYPHSDVRIEGFQDTLLPDNYIDVAIGNVPFGNANFADRKYPSSITKALHNYFFAKALDVVRPGGLVMFITSSFTMNAENAAVRQYLANRADLIGAIRLPNNAFKGNAGTEVVTDILVFKKRKPNTPYAGELFINSPRVQIGEGYYQAANINEYFNTHPEMVLGTPEIGRGMYGSNSLTYNALEGKGTLREQIENAFKNISARMEYPAAPVKENVNAEVSRKRKSSKNGSFVVNADGTVSRNENGELKKIDADDKTVKRITGMVKIRDGYIDLTTALIQGFTDETVKAARKKLNAAYDSFVKEYGYINSPSNVKILEGSPDEYSLRALEKYDAKTKTAEKADIFTRNTISPNKTITHVDTIEDGISASINTTGAVDAAYIAEITGIPVEQATKEMLDARLVFKNTRGVLESREQYLSGNVRAKLREAKALVSIDGAYKLNVEELEKVIPEDISYDDIFVTPGSPWIPTDVYTDFITHILGGYKHSYGTPDVEVARNAQTGEFKIQINNKRLLHGYNNTQEYGTSRKTFKDIIETLMDGRTVRVNDTIEDENGRKRSVLNKEETTAAQAKADKISAEFRRWLWDDDERRAELSKLYNETFNALVSPRYDGKNLTVNGLNADFSLREHQANVVQRIIMSGGNTLIAHKVGAGKTLEMAAAAMKMRETGVVKKPLFIVPKSLVSQWGTEFQSYFPAAKLLVSGDNSFSPANRKTFMNRIANGDYDAVIVSYEQFEKVPMSQEYRQRFYEEMKDEILAAIAEEKAEKGEKGLTVKQMQNKVKSIEKKISELTTKAKDDDNITFEMLGIDGLFVDEAHNFKNLEYTTKMMNVAGLGNSDGSQRAFDLYTKIRYLQELNGGRGIVFATATPVMNSMAEMYIMQKYLQSDTLKQLGLVSFDAWAKQFGEVVNGYEIAPSGKGFRMKQSFSNFKNLPELQMLFRNFTDVLTEVPGLKIPKLKDGKVKIVESDPSDFQKQYMESLAKRAENVRNVDPSVDNMLKITSDGRKISYTQRMIDPSLPYEPKGKIYSCGDNIVAEYKASKKIKGTQIVFMDMATPKGKSAAQKNSTETDVDDSDLDLNSAQLYDDLKAYLIKKGIPANEIVFIHDAKNDAQRKQLFSDMNEGKVRVLIGSTGKMGVGMNAQKRVVAIHHLDAPWRPGDVEQRDGRAFRQKNMNEYVSKYVYVTKGSFDARLWDILDRKSHFINQIMNGDNAGRTAEETGEVVLSAAEIKAIASDDPRIMEQVKLKDEIDKLSDLEIAYEKEIATAKKKLVEDNAAVSKLETMIESAKIDIKARKDGYSYNDFRMTVGKKTVTDKKEAGQMLFAAVLKNATAGTYTKIGSIAGFDISVLESSASEYKGLLALSGRYNFNVYTANTTMMVNRICDIIANLPETLKSYEAGLSEVRKDIKGQNDILSRPFEYRQELTEKRARYTELMAELNPKEEQLGNDDVQEQGRYFAEDEDKPIAKTRKSLYSEQESLFYQWAYSKEKAGNVAKFVRFGKHKFYEKTADYCIEISSEEYKKAKGYNVGNTNSKTNDEVRELVTDDGASVRTNVGNNGGINGNAEMQSVSQQTLGEELRNDTGGSVSGVDRYNTGNDIEETQNQPRTETYSDREILEMAANETSSDEYTAEEKNALSIFRSHAEKLHELENERAEQGRIYVEQQFSKNGNRAEAQKTKNRMDILDGQIQREEEALLSIENKKVLKDILKKARRIIEKKDSEKTKEALKRYRDRRDNSAKIKKYRERIQKNVNDLSAWVLNPNNKEAVKHIPEIIRNDVIGFLTSIDFTSKRQLSGKAATKADAEFANRLERLRNAIRENVSVNGLYSGYNDLPEGFLSGENGEMGRLDRHIEKIMSLLENGEDGYIINRMTSDELKELSEIVENMKAYVQNMNAFLANEAYQHVYEAGDNTVEYLRSLGDDSSRRAPAELAYKTLEWDMIRPAYGFERFGEGGKAIEAELRDGQATLAFNADKTIKFAEETYTAEEVQKWENELNEFVIDGDTVIIPTSYLMGLYELMKQPDSREHIAEGGGIRVAVFTRDKKKHADAGHKVSLTEIANMLNVLTDRQKEVADALQKYMATQGAEWLNYVSVKRFGTLLATNEQYYPINSDGRRLSATADEAPSNASLYALLNSGFTKNRVEGANNRVMLYSIFDVFSNHMASTAQYNAFALPILDAIKWLNYKTDAEKEINRISLRDELARVYGVPEERGGKGGGNMGYAEAFIKNVIKAYNGTEAQGIPEDASGIDALHRYNVAQVAFNFRVVVQQPLAITRAGEIINYSDIIQALSFSPTAVKNNIEEMYKYSGIAKWKSLGFYDINISRGLTDLIKHDTGKIDKINEVGMAGAEKMDELTWSAIWSACKKNISKTKKYAYGGEEYFKAVAKLFEEVIYKTQVVDSVLTKPQYMRSKGFRARILGSFMAEPLTTVSMLTGTYDKYREDIRKGKSRAQAWKNNKRKIGRLAFVYGLTAVLNAAVTAVIDAFRDDDDDEWYKKFLENFGSNIVEELNPLNKIPGLSQLVELFKSLLAEAGFDTYGNAAPSVIAQWSDAAAKAFKIIFAKARDEKTGYTWYAGIYALLQFVSGLTGLPLSAATRTAVNVWNNTVGYLNGKLKFESYVSSKERQNKIYNAIVNGDDKYLDKLKTEYTTEAGYKTAVSKGLYQNDERIADAAKALADGDYETYNRYFYDIAAENLFDESAIKSAINLAMNDMGISEDEAEEETPWYNEKSKSGKKKYTDYSSLEKSDIHSAFDAGNDENGNIALAEVMQGYILAGKSKEYAKSEIQSSATTYWKPKYVEAHKANNTEEMKRIRKILAKYKVYKDVSDTCLGWIKAK